MNKEKQNGTQVGEEVFESPNEAEFKAYLLLMTIAKPMEVYEYFQAMEATFFDANEIKLVASIIKSYQTADYVGFFKSL